MTYAAQGHIFRGTGNAGSPTIFHLCGCNPMACMQFITMKAGRRVQQPMAPLLSSSAPAPHTP